MEIVVRIVAYLASVGVVAGLVFAVIAFGARAKALRIAGWRTVQGEVTRAPRFRRWGALGGGLRYRYAADGRAYEAGRIRLLDWPVFLWPDAVRLQACLSTAQRVDVKVNPALSEDVALDLAPPPRAFGWAGLVLSLSCLVFLGLRRLL